MIIAEEVDTNPWYIYECVPLLKNLAGFENGSKKNSILKEYFLLDTYSSFINFLSCHRHWWRSVPALVAQCTGTGGAVIPALVAQCTSTGGAVYRHWWHSVPALVAQCVRGLLPR